MRLIDLEPSWTVESTGRHGMGIAFACPHCDGAQSVGVWFKNPLDGGPPMSEASRTWIDSSGAKRITPLWQREGDTFETLTLTPSIDASASGHWHGYVTAGIVT